MWKYWMELWHWAVKEAEGVWEYGVEENIWTEEWRGNGGMEEIV